MPTFYKSIPETLQEWIMQQPVFYIASAPTVGAHINVSPKGHPSRTLRILSPTHVLYLDATGSGCETTAHLYDNSRATIMLASHSASPRILRLFCKGAVHEAGTPEFNNLLHHFDQPPSLANPSPTNNKEEQEDWQASAIHKTVRSIISLHVFKVQTSCGYGVPVLRTSIPSERAESLTKASEDDVWCDRETLPRWAKNKEACGEVDAYWVKNNVRSLDGMPGLKAARRLKGEWIGVAEVKGFVWRVVVAQWVSVLLGLLLAVGLMGGMGCVDGERVKGLVMGCQEMGNMVWVKATMGRLGRSET
ncbi:hypothetical protein BT63DRAFT_441127 [Microthyrium microscopicum]|uniref:Pyridoxamine phosphate oxidase family protein n=1 Tax=Microthyrium microscopicum TaxID=703497 RepID=A0A6A6U5R6_9PEZI|nr:hypothetical protein BT63DRAFT_441127 [Microthyrium microscopicum]